MFRSLAGSLLGLVLFAGAAGAQERLLPPIPRAPSAAGVTDSRCLALAEGAARIVPVVFTAVAAEPGAVTIRYIGHSTFRITTPAGVTVATDFAGHAGDGPLPRVVTMNHAHSSHWTPLPDPGIEHVLRGWNPDGDGPARHDLRLDDLRIRNVTTDIRGQAWDDDTGSIREKDGNSIFIFEVAGLCLGHLGHLHHVLASEDIGWIGQLDVVMVAVDGGYTMRQEAIIETLKVLKARLVLPMHWFSYSNLSRFTTLLEEGEFALLTNGGPEITVSADALPERPTVIVLPPGG